MTAGKGDKTSRTSDGDLVAVQALLFVEVAAHAMSGRLQSKMTWHPISSVFEWIGIAFHVIYFLLALCIRVRVPAKTYAVFAVMLALAVIQTLW